VRFKPSSSRASAKSPISRASKFNPLDINHLRSGQPDLPNTALFKMCALFQEAGIEKFLCITAMKSCAPSTSEKEFDKIYYRSKRVGCMDRFERGAYWYRRLKMGFSCYSYYGKLY
jgi:hypothetical protein